MYSAGYTIDQVPANWKLMGSDTGICSCGNGLFFIVVVCIEDYMMMKRAIFGLKRAVLKDFFHFG